jgi:hypothetical protein
VEDIRQLNNYLGASQTQIQVREIDRKGYPYDYEVETKLAID